mmetsp:Transcript_80797/g.182276  ORF Transcript_80797/g.182276 Transcript_80797/m.182276 type:complete len:210 (-) Transcript_80797:14-643(-)
MDTSAAYIENWLSEEACRLCDSRSRALDGSFASARSTLVEDWSRLAPGPPGLASPLRVPPKTSEDRSCILRAPAFMPALASKNSCPLQLTASDLMSVHCRLEFVVRNSRGMAPASRLAWTTRRGSAARPNCTNCVTLPAPVLGPSSLAVADCLSAGTCRSNELGRTTPWPEFAVAFRSAGEGMMTSRCCRGVRRARSTSARTTPCLEAA